MRVLLDEQLPRRLATDLTGHQVRSVQRLGCAGLRNGELLDRAAADGFEAFLTADRNLEFQQDLPRSRLGIVVLVTMSIALEDLRRLVPATLAALARVRIGQVIRVGG